MLTPKQERFAQCVAEGMTQADAYRAAYSAERMKPATIQNKASALMRKGEVRARVEELRVPVIERLGYTLEKLVGELEQARLLALSTETPSAMINATMGKAKLLGFDKPEAEAGDSVAEALVRLADRLPD